MQKLKIYVKTFGCTLNLSDSERIKGILDTDRNIEIVDSQDKCDLEIINSCTVKDTAEQKLYREIRNAEKNNKKVIIAGCVAQAQKDLVNNKLKGYPIIGPNNIHNITKVVKDSLNKKSRIFLHNTMKPKKIDYKTKPHNKFVAIIPISEGCIGNCSYCKTKQARGELKSYPAKKIINKIKSHLKTGAKEIWLTAQDTSCYGFDINTNLARLLKKIIDIKADFKVRVGMGNPNSFLEIIEEYMEVFKYDKNNYKKLYKFFHIPVQSGSDKILKDMNRFYNVKEFKELIKIIKKNIKKPFFATDVIVGYPKEIEEDFNKTLKLIKWLKPEMLNISRFWLRPGTLAHRNNYKILPTEILKQRAKIMTSTFYEILADAGDRWKKWQGIVIITEKGKNNSLVGKNSSYKQVVFPKNQIEKNNLKLGDKVLAFTISVGNFEIVAEVLKVYVDES